MSSSCSCSSSMEFISLSRNSSTWFTNSRPRSLVHRQHIRSGDPLSKLFEDEDDDEIRISVSALGFR